MGNIEQDETLDGAVLARYLESAATPADEAHIARWLARDPAHATELTRMREFWSSARHSTVAGSLANSLDAWRAVASRITSAPRTTRPAGRSWVYRSIPQWTVAAAIVLGLGVGVVWGTGRHLSDGAIATRAYRTAPGQRETVTLTDGTQFTLAPGSVLRVPMNYADGNRTVVLDGEAMFAVVHDIAHPFAVRTRNTVATDVGTRFDVRSYAGDSVTRIGVTEGVVALVGAGLRPARPSGTTFHALLHAFDMAVVDGTGVTVIHNAAVSAMASWTSGTLVFTNAPARDVLRDLSRWYGINLHVSDPALGATPVTLTIQDGPPDQAIDGLALLLHASVDRRSNVVMFVANPNDR